MLNSESALDAIYNAGERLIPGESHDVDEVIRHKSSYEFFYQIIEHDILNDPLMLSRELKILDIGSGTGHGTFMLSQLPGVKVIGIEPGVETEEYARKNYAAENLEYINTDLETFIKSGENFDYIVSRHALEHVINGLDMALAIPFSRRLIVNVPFNEDDRNPFHLVHWINETTFANYKNKEFFYESMTGETSLTRNTDTPPNSIVCVSSIDGLEKVSNILTFPFPAWRPEFLQELGLSVLANNLPAREVQVQAREAQVQAREAQVQAREVQIEAKLAIYNRLLLVRLVRKIKRIFQ